MKAEIYWVDTGTNGRVAVMPRPRGGDWLGDEIQSFKADGVETIVSLLTNEETQELDLLQEASLCRAVGIEFRSLPILDRHVPEVSDALPLLKELAQQFREGGRIAVHCRMGIGRAVTIAAGILLLAGIPRDEVLPRLCAARGFPVPETEEQHQWIAALPDPSE